MDNLVLSAIFPDYLTEPLSFGVRKFKYIKGRIQGSEEKDGSRKGGRGGRIWGMGSWDGHEH